MYIYIYIYICIYTWQAKEFLHESFVPQSMMMQGDSPAVPLVIGGLEMLPILLILLKLLIILSVIVTVIVIVIIKSSANLFAVGRSPCGQYTHNNVTATTTITTTTNDNSDNNDNTNDNNIS